MDATNPLGLSKKLICNVCDKNEAKGVAAVPGVPISMAYCQTCLEANAHPYGIVVANTAQVGGYDNSAPWWQQIVDDTLAYLEIPREKFDSDVEADIQWMYEEELHEGTD